MARHWNLVCHDFEVRAVPGTLLVEVKVRIPNCSKNSRIDSFLTKLRVKLKKTEKEKWEINIISWNEIDQWQLNFMLFSLFPMYDYSLGFVQFRNNPWADYTKIIWIRYRKLSLFFYFIIMILLSLIDWGK